MRAALGLIDSGLAMLRDTASDAVGNGFRVEVAERLESCRPPACRPGPISPGRQATQTQATQTRWRVSAFDHPSTIPASRIHPPGGVPSRVGARMVEWSPSKKLFGGFTSGVDRALGGNTVERIRGGRREHFPANVISIPELGWGEGPQTTGRAPGRIAWLTGCSATGGFQQCARNFCSGDLGARQAVTELTVLHCQHSNTRRRSRL